MQMIRQHIALLEADREEIDKALVCQRHFTDIIHTLSLMLTTFHAPLIEAVLGRFHWA